MSEYADKSKENKSITVTNHLSQHQKIGHSFPETAPQRNMQEAINNSPQIQQLEAYQKMADNYTLKIVQQKKINSEIPQPAKKKENKTGLPDQLKLGIEGISGYFMDDVRVHYNSNKPSQLQAHAYEQGTEIHIAPGQEKHVPHEAWHIVQQKQGRVKPTLQMKGKININDDVGLEKEADVMGSRAKQYIEDDVAENSLNYSTNPSQKISQRIIIQNSINQTTTDLNEDNKLKSREASYGVYIQGERVYKIFGKMDQAQKEFDQTAAAEVDHGVPVATPISIYKALLPNQKVGYVFEAAKQNGRFFQLSKNSVLQSFIEESNNPITLNWILRALNAAIAAGINDPQGFINGENMHPIVFIDIHTGSPNGSLMDLSTIVEKKLTQMNL